jgi:hypothetical protein
VKLHFIDPGKPIQNAYIESFNGKFRDECLSQHWKTTITGPDETRVLWDDLNWLEKEDRPMKNSRYSPEQVAFGLRQAENGTLVSEVCRKMAISEQTFYRWKKRLKKQAPEDTYETRPKGMVLLQVTDLAPGF